MSTVPNVRFLCVIRVKKIEKPIIWQKLKLRIKKNLLSLTETQLLSILRPSTTNLDAVNEHCRGKRSHMLEFT